MSLRFRCPECDTPVRLPDSRFGRKNYCPRCDARLPDEPTAGGGGGNGLVIGLVLGGLMLAGMCVAGAGIAAYFIAARNADAPAKPVVQGAAPDPAAPAPQVAPAEPKADMPDPLPRVEFPADPPRFDPPRPNGPKAQGTVPAMPPEIRGPGPAMPDIQRGVPEFPRPAPPDERKPVVATIKLPPAPTPVEIKPPGLTEPTELTLPETPERAVVGGGGRFLVLHFPKSRTLAVFDANTGKLRSGYINLPEDKVYFTAGMDKLAVLLPSAGMVRRYDLLTQKLEVSKAFAVKGVNAFVMGHSSAGPLVVRGQDGAKLYDLTTFAEIPLPDADPNNGIGGRGAVGGRTLPFDGGDIWPAGNGRVFGNTGNYGMPNGIQVVSLEGGKVVKHYEHQGTWFVQPSPDGKYIFAGGYKPVTVNLKPTPDVPETGLQGGGHVSSMYLPAHHGPYYLRLVSGDDPIGRARGQKASGPELRIHLYGLAEPVAVIPQTAARGGAAPGGGADWGFLQQLPTAINLIPRANLMVIRAGDRLRLIPIDLEKELEKSGADFLVVTSAAPATYKPGAAFRYPVKARSKAGGIQYKVEAGPEGMTVAADGTVAWAPPAKFKDTISVILNLRDKAGKEAFHTFTLTPEEEGAVARVPEAKGREPDPPAAVPDPPKPPADKPGLRFPAAPPRLAIKPSAATERTTVMLPDTAARALPAGGGRFLVLHFPKTRKVGVFDVNESKVVRYINVPEDNPLLAAGMSKLAVYMPGAKVLRRYNLLTGEQEASKALDVPDVKALGLGSASAGPLVVAATGGGRLFDLDTLTEMELPKEEAPDPRFGRPPDGPRRLPLVGPNLFAAANGRLFVGSGGGVSLEGNSIRMVPSGGDGWMYNQPTADGKYVFRGGNGAITADGKKTLDVVHSNAEQGGYGGYFFLPAADGPFYFHLHFGGVRGHEPRYAKDPDQGLTVYMYGLDQPLARVLNAKDVPHWNEVYNAGIPMHERFQLVPRAKQFLTIGASRDRITLIPMDLNQAIDEAGIDFLLVTSSPPGSFAPGHEFRYPVRARSKAGGLKFSLESGPDGMKVAADGVVSWAVPRAFADPEVTIILNVKDSAGKEAFHTFRLVKTDRPEEYVPDAEPAPVPVAPKPDPKAGPRAPFKLPPAPASIELDAVELDKRKEVTVPDRFDTGIQGGDGRFLVLHARAARKAFVFDAAAGSIARTVELGDDKAVIAAGMSQLLVYRPSANEVEKFNLLTGATEGKKAIPTRGVTEMVLGSASAGPLFVRAGSYAELYDVDSLQPMDLPKADGFPFTGGKVWASADGRVWGNTVTRATGSFVRLATLSEASINVTSDLVGAAYAVPSADGKCVYVAGFGELTADLKPSDGYGRGIREAPDRAYHFLPVAGGSYLLMLHLGVSYPPAMPTLKPQATKGVTVWRRDKRAAVATLDDVTEVGDVAEESTLPGLVHYIPDARLLVAIPATRDRLALYPVRPQGEAQPPKRPIIWRLPEVPAPVAFAPTALQERKAVDLNNRVQKVCAAGGGRYLVIQNEPQKLSVFDLPLGKIAGEIAVSEGPITAFAGGMSKVVVIEHGRAGAVFRRYDLATSRLEQSAGGPGHRDHLVMGSGSAGPVLAVGTEKAVLYDLATLAPLKVPGNGLDGRKLDVERVAASADGRTFVGVESGPTGGRKAVTLQLARDGVVTTTRDAGLVVNSVAASPDGSRVFIGGQGIFTADLKTAADVVWSPTFPLEATTYAYTFAPAAEGPYYLHVHLGSKAKDDRFATDPQFGVTVYKYGQEKPVGRLPNVVNITRTTGDWLRIAPPTKLYTFLPSAKLLAAFDPTLSRLHLIPLDPANIPELPVADPTPAPPKKGPSKTRPKAESPAAPAAAGKPFRLPPLPEPLPIAPLKEAKTFTFSEPAQMSPIRVRAAGGGRFLVVQRHSQKLDVFDLNVGAVARQIELPTPGMPWTAGMTKLFVYDRELRGLRRFDLLTGKSELSKAYARAVTPVAMGSATDGPILCRDGGVFRFVDGETLDPLDLNAAELAGPGLSNREAWMSPDGRTIGFGLGNLMPSAPQMAQVQTVTFRVGPTGLIRASGQFPSTYAIPDSTGRYLFAGGHGVFDINLKKTPDAVRSEDPSPRDPPTHWYLPALSGPFYVRYHQEFAPGRAPAPGGERDAELSVYVYGQSRPMMVLSLPDPLEAQAFNPFALGRLGERVFMVPAARALVVVSGRGDKIRLNPLDPSAEMVKARVEVPWVSSDPPRAFQPGVEVKYPMRVATKAGGLKFTLDAPVAGMNVSADGVFSWAPPATTPAEVRVTIRVKDANDRESVHSFPLTRQ